MSDMYIAGSGSCQISVSEPASLVIALYVREQIGISPTTLEEIPALDPSSQIWPAWAARPWTGLPGPADPSPFDGKVDREQAGREWARWWRHALAVGPAAADDLRPPRFTAFSGTPSLRQVLQHYYEAANLWTEAISSDPLVKRAHGVPREGLQEIVRHAEQSFRTRPFRLRITVIPVRTERAWQLAPDHIMVTRHLIADRDNVLDWLRPRILALC